MVEDGGTGLLVPPGDDTALADALVALAGDARERRRTLGEAALARARTAFSLDDHVARMEAVLLGAAAPSRG